MVDKKKQFNDEEEMMDVYDAESGEMEESFADLFENSLKDLVPGIVVIGTIVQVIEDSLVVDVGG